ncbi:MAG TPA: hypothetical protein ENJ54_02160 [Chloroflexi bacterium]|nr:hypothetical protein [Chloroflexota bacterium]
MRFLVDECTGPVVARWLRSAGHEVFSVYDHARGATDAFLIGKAVHEGWIIVTNDKDFGEMIFRGGYRPRGVLLLRLDDERSPNKIAVLKALLETYGEQIRGHFVVVTEDRARFTPIP